MAVRRWLVNAGLVLLLFAASLPGAVARPVAGTRPSQPALPTPVPSATAPTPSPTPSEDPGPAPLTLDMAVGQMMAASFAGPNITAGLRHLILDEKVGTVLIFADNFRDAAGLA